MRSNVSYAPPAIGARCDNSLVGPMLTRPTCHCAGSPCHEVTSGSNGRWVRSAKRDSRQGMRQGPHQKRGRGRGNRRSNTPNRNQTYDSNGPDVRIRGNASQVYEKYLNLARDATTSGDRVLAESYFQHAEHSYRILAAFQESQRSEEHTSELQS